MVESGTDDNGIIPSLVAGTTVARKNVLLSCRIFLAAEVQAAPRHLLLQQFRASGSKAALLRSCQSQLWHSYSSPRLPARRSARKCTVCIVASRAIRLLQCLTLRQQLTKPHPGHPWIQLVVQLILLQERKLSWQVYDWLAGLRFSCSGSESPA